MVPRPASIASAEPETSAVWVAVVVPPSPVLSPPQRKLDPPVPKRGASIRDGKPRCGTVPYRTNVMPPVVVQPGTFGDLVGRPAPTPCSKPPLSSRFPASGGGPDPSRTLTFRSELKATA